MPRSERGPDGGPSPEGEDLPRYHQAARFAGEEPACLAYFAAQEAIYTHAGEIDLSAYRFQLNRVYHVAVLGNPPPTELHDRLRAILAAGDQARAVDRRALPTRMTPDISLDTSDPTILPPIVLVAPVLSLFYVLPFPPSDTRNRAVPCHRFPR